MSSNANDGKNVSFMPTGKHIGKVVIKIREEEREKSFK